MLVPELFQQYPRIARSVAKQDAAWLAYHREHVLQMAADCGIDLVEIAAAIAYDTGDYSPTPPDAPVCVDVVIPFCEYDTRYVAECVQSIFDQNHCHPVVHVVADGCEFPELPEISETSNLLRYQTSGSWGPYRICNAIVAGGNLQTEYLAIQDGDDVSHPDRLWRQVQTLRYTGAEMISSASKNFLQPGTTDPTLINRLGWEPVIRPGRKYNTCPNGRLVNSTRTMIADLFRRLNGFRDMRCTGDFQFDNRARFAGILIVDDQTVLARRRLHSGSMTGGRFVPGTAVRNQDVATTNHAKDMMQQTPTLLTAQMLGSLDNSPQLYPLTTEC